MIPPPGPIEPDTPARVVVVVRNDSAASAIVTPTCCKTTKTVEVKGSQITDVTFGLDKSITAVTQIEYEV
jgi:hypothetical protein